MPVKREEDEVTRSEETCLEAEDWAHELESYYKAHPTCAEAGEISSLAQMLRAMVKSIRLSIVAEESAEDRGFLIEELVGAIKMAGTVTGGPARSVSSSSPSEEIPDLFAGPQSSRRTAPPPPGMSPRDILSRELDLPSPHKPTRRS